MRSLLDGPDALRGLSRVAGEIIERHRGVKNLVLVGIRRGGVPLAEHLRTVLRELEGDVALGTLDITLYRDDAATALPNPRIGPSELPMSVSGKRVVLVDDVLFTGRTVRAAVDALLDYGRPERIELAVLVDRGGRELPIQADYFVKQVDVPSSERVDVFFENGVPRAVVQDGSAPTIPPAAPKSPENQK
jgi:pyrimidine operon attenuation protein/uracil phosphoribosyltransferase